jgi:hypothetical protein
LSTCGIDAPDKLSTYDNLSPDKLAGVDRLSTPEVEQTPDPGAPAHVHASPTPPPPPTGGAASSSDESDSQQHRPAAPEEIPPHRPDFSEPVDLLDADISSLCRKLLEYEAWARRAATEARRAEGLEPQPAVWSEADVSKLRAFVTSTMNAGYEPHRVLAWSQRQLELTGDRDTPIVLGRAIWYLSSNLRQRKPGTYDELSPDFEWAPEPETPTVLSIRSASDYTEEEKRQIAAENDRGIDYMAQLRAKMGGAK